MVNGIHAAPQGALTQLRRHNARRKFRSCVQALIASKRLLKVMSFVYADCLSNELMQHNIKVEVRCNSKRHVGCCFLPFIWKHLLYSVTCFRKDIIKLNKAFATATQRQFLADRSMFIAKVKQVRIDNVQPPCAVSCLNTPCGCRTPQHCRICG